MKLTDFKLRWLNTNSLFIVCHNCKKDLCVKKWYETSNLLYLCKDCYNKLLNKAKETTNK